MADTLLLLRRQLRRYLMALLLLALAPVLLLALESFYPVVRSQWWWLMPALAVFSISALWLLWRRISAQLQHYQTIESWAEQYLQQPVAPTPGDGTLSQALLLLHQRLEQAQQNDSRIDQLIRERALYDRETGVGNREFFSNRLDALLCEEDARGAVLLLQLQEGEPQSAMMGCLMAVIEAIKAEFTSGPQYYLARQQEFELALLLPNIYVDETEKIANRLLSRLKHVTAPDGVNNAEFLHIGISCFHGQKAYQIMAEADMALRSAQLQGPSQWFMFDPGELAQQEAKGSLRWRTLLLWALEHQAVRTFCQPVFYGEEWQVLHQEVFAKLRDKQGKYISARVFLPMAQKSGLASKIDAQVFLQVWQYILDNPGQSFSVNLSMESLLSRDFIKSMLLRLRQQPEAAKRLIVEISEYHLAQQLDVRTHLNLLTSQGVCLLVDRVGQYVVNAEYLKTCQVSMAKLHRSIVMDIQHKPENQVFIQSYKTLCDERQIALYALGVEYFEEWKTLRRLGVTGGQGHYFTKPTAQVNA